MTINDYISRGRVKDAIQMLPEGISKTMLLSRHSDLQSKHVMGVMSDDDHRIAMNKLVHSVLSEASESGVPSATPVQLVPHQSSVLGSDLLDIYKSNRRRNPDFAKEVKVLMDKYSDYNTSLSTQSGFDKSGRRLRALEEEKQKLFNRSEEAVHDSKESKVKKVNNLIAQPVPSWDDLQEAWGICQGIGMHSHWIARALENRPNDDDVKINIAEAIEQFVDKF